MARHTPEWFDAQYDRRRVSASRPEVQGGTVQVELVTGLGPQVLRARKDELAAVEDFCRRLGYRHR